MLINEYFLSQKIENGKIFDASDMVIKVTEMRREIIDFHINYKMQ